MEVHHHSHLASNETHTSDPGLRRGRRKWTEYFWEFLMLFLAVTLGFFVENQREHYIEHIREKKYIQSLFNDLKADTVAIEDLDERKRNVCKMIDTVIMLLKGDSRKSASSRIYYLVRKIPYSEGRFSFSTKTYEQLKNSGNLRLIRNTSVLDMISDYYHDADNSATRGPLDMNFENRHDLYLSVQKLFDAGVFHKMMDADDPFVFSEPPGHPPLLTEEPIIINEICTRLHFMYGTHRVIMADNERLRVKAIELMKKLQQEYHLK
ncbi:MAG TPA: hypothetical protein VFP97_01185 [Chitinophagaceae bacterium]|nr:hypothetical protein [Chitinophagaceae bacterium]